MFSVTSGCGGCEVLVEKMKSETKMRRMKSEAMKGYRRWFKRFSTLIGIVGGSRGGFR